MISYDVVSEKLLEVRPLDEEVVCDEIERVIATFQLTITQRTTLSTKKGSYHWHTKFGKEKGVLEITYWPSKGRLWLEIADNRQANWNLELIGALARNLADSFTGQVVKK